jgi:putative hydroxymethylpyrimidine transport system substrate-binding protein
MPGYHLPYIGAAASGLFAEHGLDVELLEPAEGPENVKRVAAGGAEFCLTSVAHYLKARYEAGDLAARFVAVVVQRSPMAAIVPWGSPIREASDLPGRRVGGREGEPLVAAFQAGMSQLGLDPAQLVAVDYAEAPGALGRGEIDAIPDFADLVPRIRRQSGIPVRAVPLGTEVYASGLVAGDVVPDAVVERMRAALVAALERQRSDPRHGLTALVDRYPGADPEDALEGWSLAEPNIFTAPVGSMDRQRWKATIAHVAAARRMPPPEPETVYRLSPAVASFSG